jgi:hypothetical protein
MKKVIVKIKVVEGKDGSKVSFLSISALDSFGNSVPVSGSIIKERMFGSRLIIPHYYLSEEQEIVIEPDQGLM